MRARRRAGRASLRGGLLLLMLAGLAPPVFAQQSPPAPAPQSPPAAATQPPAEAPALAVLPFRVYSAQPLEYLGTSLADLLRARLDAGGRLRVLEAAASAQRPEPQQGETQDAAARRTARSLGVDYVVTGNLTELAGRFSLDVRVTPAELAIESHTEVFTAQREEDLLAKVDEIADRVTEQIVGAAPAVVARVDIKGAPGFEQDLMKRLGTKAGQPYDPLTVRADLTALRANPAVVSAEAETERTDKGVVVHFDIVLAAPQLGAPGLGRGDVIAEVRIRGNRRIESDAIRARIGSKPGTVFNPAQVARDITEVNALGFFRNVRVLTEKGPEGRILIFEVEENPVIRQISISGNDHIASDKIRDVLTITTGATLDYPLVYENRKRIEGLYRAQGYYLAEVNFEIEPLGTASVGVHFQVDEKEKLKLRSIAFEGNEHFSDDELTSGFQTKVWHLWSYATSWFDHSGTYSEPLFVQDLRQVEKKYTDAGYLRVEIGEPQVHASEKGLSVTVKVTEGRRFHVGKLDVTGDSTVDIDSLRGKLELKEGEWFNRSHLTEDIASLTQYYQDRGFYFAQVTPLSNLSQTSDVVDVTFDVRKGPLYFIRRIDVAGNTITVDPVIRREIPIVEGQLYSQRSVLLAKTRVKNLGYFENVDFKMEPTDEPDQLDMKVNVVEKPTGSFSFGAGYSSQDGLVVTGSLSQSNLFGRGYGANVSVDFGGRTQRFFLNLSDPYFLDTDFSLGITGSRTNIRYESFDQEQLGGDVVLGHALTEDNTARGFLRYSYNLRRLADNRQINGASLIFREVIQDRLSSSLVGLSAVSDTRDDRLAPTSGHRYGLSLEGAGLGGFTKFLRLEGRAAWWLGAPRWLPGRSSFVFGTRVGWALPLNLIGDFQTVPVLPSDQVLIDTGGGQVKALDQIDTNLRLPLTERYFLGGIGQFQLRGFRARSVGPRRPILHMGGTPTYKYPLGTVFAPVGVDVTTGKCADFPSAGGALLGGNFNGLCNDINAKRTKDFADLQETDVIGGNKFISTSVEYRFPISETVGLQGILFLDMGNAFDETQDNLFDVTEWRYGTGAGIQWFSPFGPLAVVLGFPLDKLKIEESPVFEFSVGGGDY